MIKLPLLVVRVAAFCLPLALVASCGSGSGAESVQATTINISPTSVGVSSVIQSPLVTDFFIQAYQVELRAPSGYPQIGTRVTIVNSGTLYDGLVSIDPATITCAAGVCTSSDPSLTELPRNHGVYETTTDSTGTVRATMIYAFDSGTKGTASVLEAFSGTSYNKTDAVFTCLANPTNVPPLTCP